MSNLVIAIAIGAAAVASGVLVCWLYAQAVQAERAAARARPLAAILEDADEGRLGEYFAPRERCLSCGQRWAHAVSPFCDACGEVLRQRGVR